MASHTVVGPEFIGEKQVVDALTPVQPLVDALEEAFRNVVRGGEGGVEQPIRTSVPVKDHEGLLLVMPGYSSNDQALATKVITLFKNNTTIPSHQGVVLLFDPTNGSLKSIIDANSLTELRTAAASAVATKHLFRGEPKVLAIVGAGVQGKSHWDVFSQLYSFSEVKVYSRTLSSSEKLVSHIGSIGKVCDRAEDAVREADIIVTATFAKAPVIFNDWIKPGAHINAVGACTPEFQEIDPVLMKDAVLFVDSREAANVESGDVIKSKAEIYAEIGEVIDGRKEAKHEKTTIFKSLGMAIEDVVAAKLVYDLVHKT